MAIVNINLSPSISYRAFDTASDPELRQSILPRGVMTAQIDSESIAACASADQNHIRIRFTLPNTFVYRMATLLSSIANTAAGGNAYYDDALLELTNSFPDALSDTAYQHVSLTRTDPTGTAPSRFDGSGGALNQVQTYRITDPGTNIGVIQAPEGKSTQISVYYLVVGTAQAVTLQFQQQFYVYDLAQAQAVEMHTPVPVVIS